MAASDSPSSDFPHFQDLDGCSDDEFGNLLYQLNDAEAQNFVLDFGEEQAQVAFNVREEEFPQLLESGVSVICPDQEQIPRSGERSWLTVVV
jgi:hypothetical protein